MSKGKKRLLILLPLVVVSLTLMSYQRNGRAPSFFEALSYPYYFLSKISFNVNSSVAKVFGALEENKRLKKDLVHLLLERQQYREMMEENKRLNSLLGLKSEEPRYLTAADVIARGHDRLLNTVTLDKGKNQGVEKGMAVITTKGLVGKVYAVRDDFSDVLLMKDINFSAAVRLQTSRREGVLCGTGYGYLALKYIPPEETVSKAEVVITSGLDGLFPPGLQVGVISKVQKEGIEFFQYIEVTPFQSSEKLEEVVILK